MFSSSWRYTRLVYAMAQANGRSLRAPWPLEDDRHYPYIIRHASSKKHLAQGQLVVFKRLNSILALLSLLSATLILLEVLFYMATLR